MEGGHISWARASEARLHFSCLPQGFSLHASQTSVVIFTKSHNENPSSETKPCEAGSAPFLSVRRPNIRNLVSPQDSSFGALWLSPRSVKVCCYCCQRGGWPNSEKSHVPLRITTVKKLCHIKTTTTDDLLAERQWMKILSSHKDEDKAMRINYNTPHLSFPSFAFLLSVFVSLFPFFFLPKERNEGR